MKTHELKTWPEYFESVFTEDKRFELRKNDRHYQVGDILHLREWSPDTEKYTGRELWKEISYIFQGGKMGVQPEYVIMSLRSIPQPSPELKR